MTPPASCLVCLGGRLPAPEAVVLATGAFRRVVLARALHVLRPDVERPMWQDLSVPELEGLTHLTGKRPDGSLLPGNRHLVLWPWWGHDEEPDRILAWRCEGLTEAETAFVLGASRRPLRWGEDDRVLQLAPFGRLPLPLDWTGPACAWVSRTPFVPTGGRYRFRTDGSPKKSETPMRQAALLCVRKGLPEPKVELLDSAGPVRVHQALAVRRRLAEAPEPRRPASHWPGCWLSLRFSEPVTGPLFLGHSGHFGLGHFVCRES